VGRLADRQPGLIVTFPKILAEETTALKMPEPEVLDEYGSSAPDVMVNVCQYIIGTRTAAVNVG
jgi:hypothetical protein